MITVISNDFSVMSLQPHRQPPDMSVAGKLLKVYDGHYVVTVEGSDKFRLAVV